MKDELLAEQLQTFEDDEIIYVYRYGRTGYFCELNRPPGKHRFVVPSMFMHAYVEKLSHTEETLYEFLKDGVF